jgi:hypothetical protein
MNELQGDQKLTVDLKTIPTHDEFYDDFNRESMLADNFSFSNKGVKAIEKALQLLEEEDPNIARHSSKKEYSFYLSQNGVLREETRNWDDLRNEIAESKRLQRRRNYTIIDGKVCFKTVPIIGWEAYYETIREVVQSMPRERRKTKLVMEEVKKKYTIPRGAIRKFCELCRFHQNNSNSNNNALLRHQSHGVLTTINALVHDGNIDNSTTNNDHDAAHESDMVLDFESLGETSSHRDETSSSRTSSVIQHLTNIDLLGTLKWHEIVEMLKGQLSNNEDDDDETTAENGPIFLLQSKEGHSAGVGLFHTDFICLHDQEFILTEIAGHNSSVTVDLKKDSVTIFWNESHEEHAAELLLLLLQKANLFALSSGYIVAVNGATDGNINGAARETVAGILPFSAHQLEHMNFRGQIVFENCRFTDDQEKGLAGVAAKMTLKNCTLDR